MLPQSPVITNTTCKIVLTASVFEKGITLTEYRKKTLFDCAAFIYNVSLLLFFLWPLFCLLCWVFSVEIDGRDWHSPDKVKEWTERQCLFLFLMAYDSLNLVFTFHSLKIRNPVYKETLINGWNQDRIVQLTRPHSHVTPHQNHSQNIIYSGFHFFKVFLYIYALLHICPYRTP